MKNRYFLLALFVLLGSSAYHAQTATPQPTPPQGGDEVVRITTKLVQIDAVVTDKSGKAVTDLKESDFQLLQDGKPQKITNLTYVNTGSQRTGTLSVIPGKKSSDVPTPPTPPVNPSTPGRLITFIIDDGNCSASAVGMNAARDGLKKFVMEQMLAGDRVAIFRTRTGSSVFQQYMSDRSQLLRSIEKVRWHPPNGSCEGDGSFFEAARSNILDKIGPDGMSSTKLESDMDRKARESGEDFSRNNQINGTLGVINYVVKGLERVGGRKIVFVMSDGIRFRNRNGQVMTAADSLKDLAELANRASVVFNTIDVRGVFSTSIIEARDEVRTLSDVNASDAVIANRDLDNRLAQDGMYFLADATGGRFYQNSNNLDVPVKRALSLEQGYYLLAYEPADETFRDKNFNKIEVKVTRPDLNVRSRSGFFGVVDQKVKTKKGSVDSELYEAIAAPIAEAGLNLQLTAFFGNLPEAGSFVRLLMHLRGDEITFVDDTGGMKKAVFDVVAVTMDEKNKVVDEFTRTHTFRVQPEATSFIKQHGLVYSTDVPIKSSGSFNFRVAVRDNGSKLIGSSSQLVEIPDLKKGKLYLSGLTISQVDANGKFAIPGPVKPENALTMISSGAAPAIRDFHRGAILAYAYSIYNAQLDKATHQPNVTIQMKLFRDGQMVSEGKPEPATFEKQADWTRISDFAYLRLNAEVEPGDYTLQVIVKDLLATGKNAVSSQWVDFEVLP